MKESKFRRLFFGGNPDSEPLYDFPEELRVCPYQVYIAKTPNSIPREWAPENINKLLRDRRYHHVLFASAELFDKFMRDEFGNPHDRDDRGNYAHNFLIKLCRRSPYDLSTAPYAQERSLQGLRVFDGSHDRFAVVGNHGQDLEGGTKIIIYFQHKNRIRH